jgi:hypothetical protein
LWYSWRGCQRGSDPRAGWAVLVERTVRNRVDHDTIPVTVARGGFPRLKFSVRGHAIQFYKFYKLQVRYSNGAPDIKAVSWIIPRDGQSREIDLRGGDRALRYIDFWYDAKSLGGTPALIRLRHPVKTSAIAADRTGRTHASLQDEVAGKRCTIRFR